MLLTLLVWIYISFVCLAWGNGILRLTRTATAIAGSGSLFIALFTGLAGIGIIGLYLSLVIPLSLVAHLVISLPAIAFYFFPANRRLVKEQWRESKANFSLPTILLAAAGLLMILAISSYDIIHPDTLRYHGQAIKWMEEYPIVPGTAHIDIHLGLQSWWFGVMALFRFSWIASHPYLFVNGCVAVWFTFFVAERIGKHSKWSDLYGYAGWSLLLWFCLLSWTQLRLTSSSASPDFIAALYTWGAIYLFMNAYDAGQKQTFFLPFFFCCAAFGIKLSAAPVMLLAFIILFILIRKRQIKTVVSLLFAGVILLSPVIARNIISSGYPFFPTLFADVVPATWKLPSEELAQWQHYITAYARMQAESYEAAERIMQLPFLQWAAQWALRISPGDQCLLLTIVLLFLYNLVTAKRQWKQCGAARKIVFITALAGSVAWFLTAPDPRFGFAFLIPLAYSLYAGLSDGLSRKVSVRDSGRKAGVLLLGLAILAYTSYRLVNYFDAGQLIKPKGIVKTAYKETSCQGITVTVPEDGDNCGMAPLPCLKQPCDSMKIIDMLPGFRKK